MEDRNIIQRMSFFGERLRASIDAKNISQYRLYKLSGVSESSISKIISLGRRPSDAVIHRFASVEALGLTEETMLEWRMKDDYPEQSSGGGIEAAKKIFEALSKEEQIELIKSKMHLIEQVKQIDEEEKRRK